MASLIERVNKGTIGKPTQGPFKPTNGSGGRAITERPTALEPRFESIPHELRALPNWVLWKYEPPKNPEAKWRKVPYQQNGRKADTTKRRTWCPFEAVCAAYEQGGYDGIGFVFDGEVGPDGTCLVGIDLDDCMDTSKSKIQPFAMEWIKRLNTYTEISPSGTGLHLIARTEPVESVKTKEVEIYTTARYFTFTGRKWDEESPIRVATAEVRALIAEVQAAKRAAGGKTNEAGLTPHQLFDAPLFGGAKVPEAFAHLDPKVSLGEGVSKNYWFDQLQPEQKDEAVDYALDVIASKTLLFETEQDGGNNDQYYRLTTAVARSGAPNAPDIFVKYASAAKNPDPEDALRDHFARCQKDPRGQGISVGTLLKLALEHGADFEKWKRQVPDLPILPPEKRQPLKGGVYNETKALELLNSHFFVGKRENEAAAIHRINDNESLTFLRPNDFNLEVENIFVAAALRPLMANTFWRRHRQRHQRTIVFEPHRTVGPNEYNLWRGFGVKPSEGTKRRASLLRHILEVSCRRGETKFRYTMGWMAWKAQNPDKHPETVIVIKGEEQGGGKTILSDVMRMIFGKHATVITHPDQLFGRFTEFLESMCFLQIEEALWAGDPKIADRMKAFITGQIIPIERKWGPQFTIPNRLASIITSNHQHAVTLGLRDRRYFVMEADPKYAGNLAYFKRLWDDINNGGVNEFLHLLLNMQLGDWHPRDMPKTAEAYEQQRYSSNNVLQWMQQCIITDGIKSGLLTFDLGSDGKPAWFATDQLYESYVAACRQLGWQRAAQINVFGRECAQVFGPSYRSHNAETDSGRVYYSDHKKPPRRAFGFDIPNGEKWQDLLNERMGIPNK